MQAPTILTRGAGGVLSAALLTACAGDPSAGNRSAEDAGAVPLGEADAAWDEGFSVVSTVRELPGGRVLVADPLIRIVVALDLDAGLADTIGGVGSGPAEYRQPDAVDSVGAFKRASITVEFSGRGVGTRPVPLSPTDAWGVAADGRVVVARVGDYRVEWIAADGTVTSGAPVP